MATYKVYRKGNFLEVVDLDNGQVWNAPVYDAFIEKLHDPLQYRYRFHFSDGKFLDRILLEEIVDENSAPYTAQSFDTFRTCKLGYVPIGFGCGESINIPQDFLDLTDTPDSYSGAANQYVRVNATATGLEFFALDLSIYAETADLGAVAFSNDYNDLDNLPVVSSTNIYNADGTLTGNRTVTGATYNLTFNTLGDLKFNSKTAGYLMGYYDVGDGRPEFVLDCVSGGNTISRMKSNGTDVLVSRTIGTSLWEQYREWQVRSIVTNNIHMIRDIDGQWLFTNDATGLQTPESGVRVKFYGQVKTISPSASALDTAFSVRNNTDTSNLFVVNGAGRIGVNGSPLAFSRLYITAPNGEYAGFFESTDETAMYASASSGRAIYAISTTGKGIEAISTGSYGGQFKSRDNYAVWSQSTGVGSQLSILSNGQCDFKNYADTLTVLQLLNDGKIGMPNIPTSASGLSAGQIWNNGGVLNIV